MKWQVSTSKSRGFYTLRFCWKDFSNDLKCIKIAIIPKTEILLYFIVRKINNSEQDLDDSGLAVLFRTKRLGYVEWLCGNTQLFLFLSSSYTKQGCVVIAFSHLLFPPFLSSQSLPDPVLSDSPIHPVTFK